MIDDLTENNWLIYAAKEYSKPNILQSEFEEDISRLLYIKRLLSKYVSSGIIKDRLILNHLIVFCNVFGITAATRIIFLKFNEKDLIILKPFLLYIDSLPDIIFMVNGKNIITTDILMDQKVIEILRNLKWKVNKLNIKRQIEKIDNISKGNKYGVV